MTSLKAELKAWEALFRSQNGGRDPSKADIKADAAIASKYKLYAKSKSAPVSSSNIPTKPSAVPSPSTVPPLQPSIFKTPTKPKPPKPARSAVAGPSSTTSPTKTTNSVSRSPAKPTYVVANSPSKLRALAASHSAYSPNSAPAGLGSASRGGAGGGGELAGGGITIIGSPKKYNPFRPGASSEAEGDGGRRSVSPKKSTKNVFADDSMDVDASRSLSARKMFGAVGGGGSSIFGSPTKPFGKIKRGNDEFTRAHSVSDVDMAGVTDDEVFGPSPVKPSARGKSYRPLFGDSPPSKATAPLKPKLFQSDISHLRRISVEPCSSLSADLGSKKRIGAANAFDLDKPIKKSHTGPIEQQYASQSTSKGKKGKAAATKKTRTVAKGKSKPTKFTAPAATQEDEEIEHDEEGFETRASMQRRNERSIRVLDLDDSGEEEDGERDDDDEEEVGDADGREAAGELPPVAKKLKERVIVHPIRPYFRPGQDVDDNDAPGRSGRDSLYYHDSVDLLSTSRSSVFNTTENQEDSSMTTEACMDPQLAAILELRSSPNKRTALLRERERELRIKKLLHEPSAMKARKGLEDLEEEDGAGSEEDENEGGGGSDDDWASDVDGWKGLGNGEMDYDEW